MNNVKFINSIEASLIDNKLEGLKWITPNKKNKTQVIEEVELIKQSIEVLKKDKKEKMILTNYSFYSVLLNSSQNSISRWFPGDNSAFPDSDSFFFTNYKNFFSKIINNKKIRTIYLLADIDSKNLLMYFSEDCFSIEPINRFITKYEIKDKC